MRFTSVTDLFLTFTNTNCTPETMSQHIRINNIYLRTLDGTDNGLYVYRDDAIPLQHIIHNSRNIQSLTNNNIWKECLMIMASQSVYFMRLKDKFLS